MTGRVQLRSPLTLDECQQVRVWRNAPDVLPMLRTKAPLTDDQQAAFYRDVIGNPAAPHRYYALEHGAQFIGMGGLTYLDREPGQAEISLLLGPAWRGRGLGTAAVEALLAEAFGPLRLRAVIGECYLHSPALGFWERQLIEVAHRVTPRVDEHALCWRWEPR